MGCGCRGTNTGDLKTGMATTRNRPTPRPSRSSRDVPPTDTTSPDYFSNNVPTWDGAKTVPPPEAA